MCIYIYIYKERYIYIYIQIYTNICLHIVSCAYNCSYVFIEVFTCYYKLSRAASGSVAGTQRGPKSSSCSVLKYCSRSCSVRLRCRSVAGDALHGPRSGSCSFMERCRSVALPQRRCRGMIGSVNTFRLRMGRVGKHLRSPRCPRPKHYCRLAWNCQLS